MGPDVSYTCLSFLHLNHNQRRGHAESAWGKKTNSEINSNCTGWKYAENINIKLISDGVSSTNAVVVLSL